MMLFALPRFAGVLVLSLALACSLVPIPAGVSAQAQPRAKVFYVFFRESSEVPPILNVHSRPSTQSPIVGALTLNTRRIDVTGREVVAEDRVWLPIKLGALVGWADSTYLRGRDVYVGNRRVFSMDPETDATAGCSSVGRITYAPTNRHLLIALQCFESDNELFVMQADGRGLRRITNARQFDVLEGFVYQWARDGRSLSYKRYRSCCLADDMIRPDAPLVGLVRYDLRTGEKTVSGFRVVNARPGDVLNIRARPSAASQIVGTIPTNGRGITVIGGNGVIADGTVWRQIRYGKVTGYVNGSYLSR